jgi:hypothetical protein
MTFFSAPPRETRFLLAGRSFPAKCARVHRGCNAAVRRVRTCDASCPQCGASCPHVWRGGATLWRVLSTRVARGCHAAVAASSLSPRPRYQSSKSGDLEKMTLPPSRARSYFCRSWSAGFGCGYAEGSRLELRCDDPSARTQILRRPPPLPPSPAAPAVPAASKKPPVFMRVWAAESGSAETVVSSPVSCAKRCAPAQDDVSTRSASALKTQDSALSFIIAADVVRP